MKSFMWIPLMGATVLGGCYVGPPRQRVVERDVVDANGNVVERDTVVEEAPPPPARVEVVGVAPYPGAVWIRGYWVRGYRHRWVWVRGYWR